MRLIPIALVLCLAGVALHAGAQQATTAAAQPEMAKPPVPFTETYLTDEANIAAGQAVWEEQCRYCHGRAAYPGKAPKLRPSRYTPEFVYHRVTNGFRKMPSWKEVYTDEERMAVTAYVLSPKFAP